MKTITEGHLYALDSFEGTITQRLQFIHKMPKTGANGSELKTIMDGTTNEEVLKVLINRMQYLQNKMACEENAIVIIKLKESLMWLEKRTRDRLTRKVEGTQLK